MSQDPSKSRRPWRRAGLVPVVVIAVAVVAVALGLLSTVCFEPLHHARGGAHLAPAAAAAAAASHSVEPLVDTRVPDASAVFRGREMPAEESAPTF